MFYLLEPTRLVNTCRIALVPRHLHVALDVHIGICRPLIDQGLPHVLITHNKGGKPVKICGCTSASSLPNEIFNLVKVNLHEFAWQISSSDSQAGGRTCTVHVHFVAWSKTWKKTLSGKRSRGQCQGVRKAMNSTSLMMSTCCQFLCPNMSYNYMLKTIHVAAECSATTIGANIPQPWSIGHHIAPP